MREGVGKIWEKREREREKQLKRSSILSSRLLEKYLPEKRILIETKILSLGPSSWLKKVFPIVGNSFPILNK